MLVPYVDCLEGFENLMSDNPIACHVKELHYDAESRWEESWDWYSSISECSTAQFEAVDALREMELSAHDRTTEISLLSNCFRKLPNLKAIHVSEAYKVDLDNSAVSINDYRSSYFARLGRHLGGDFHLVKSEGCEGEAAGSTTAILACVAAERELEKFSVCNLEPQFFFHISTVDVVEDASETLLARAFFSRLRHVDLRFEFQINRFFANSSRWHANHHLGKVLTAARELEDLAIGGPGYKDPPFSESDAGSESDESWLSSIIRDENHAIRRAPLFPRLKNLTLDKVACQESELVAMVWNHRKSLKSLCLSNVTLVQDTGSDSIPCLVRLLKAIRACNVPRVVLDERLSNNGSQCWQIKSYHSSTRGPNLKRRVEAWLTGKGGEEIERLEAMAVRIDADGKEIRSSEGKKHSDLSWDFTARS